MGSRLDENSAIRMNHMILRPEVEREGENVSGETGFGERGKKSCLRYFHKALGGPKDDGMKAVPSRQAVAPSAGEVLR